MTETWTLPMTADEIGEMYRTAKSKAKQVGILAELNATSKERIVAILTEAGFQVDGRATRYLKEEKVTEENPSTADAVPLPLGKGGFGGEAADTHTHTAPTETGSITVGCLLLALAEIPKESLVLIGEESMQGISAAVGKPEGKRKPERFSGYRKADRPSPGPGTW